MATHTGKKYFKQFLPSTTIKWVRLGLTPTSTTTNADSKKFNKGLEKI